MLARIIASSGPLLNELEPQAPDWAQIYIQCRMADCASRV